MEDWIIIGAGYGGVAAASLLQKRGFGTTILEAHKLIGGCASFYKRKDFLFDVGATTFSGILPSQPIGKLFLELGVHPDFYKVDPGMIIKFPERDIIRYADESKWLAEVNKHFPEKNMTKFWNRIFKLEKLAWNFIAENGKIPPRSLSDFISLVKFTNINKLPMLPQLFRSVSTELNSLNIKNSHFEKFLDEQLMITTQSKSKIAPMLTAALGLAYPSETYYPMGGMYKPAELILSKYKEEKGNLILKERVISITHKSGFYELKTENGTYNAKGIISNIPIWNMAEITEGEIQKYFTKIAKKYYTAPGAFTINFAIESKIDLPSLYFQVHSRIPIPYCEAGAFFVSFSHKEDSQKAPEGFRTVTISTHTNPKDWIGLKKEDYKAKKETVSSVILNEFDFAFPELREANKFFPLSGTPKTFENYTNRKNGYVGGIAHSVHSNLLFMTPNKTPFKNLYLVGDTVFPGQGIPAVVLGALNVVNRISS
jgi:C-3',4' desaturase CrtD